MKKIGTLWGIIFVLLLILTITLITLLPSYFEQQQGEGLLEQGKVVATFDNQEITQEEFLQQLVKIYGPAVLEEMIERRLIFSKAKRLGISIPEEEIERELLHLRQDNVSEEDFFHSIQEQLGITPEELREEIRYYLLLNEMATLDIVITEEEMATYYEENLDLFLIPTRFHLHQIIVPTLAEAEQVIAEIRQGSSFEAVAAERSIDLITSSNGGDMGIVSSNDFFLPWELVLRAEEIPMDTLSDPIEVPDGYAVIKITQRIPGGQQSFQEVKSKIRRELALQQIDGIHLFLEMLKREANINIQLPNFNPENE